MPTKFWNVYAFISMQWYQTEYGQVEDKDRFWQPAMIFLEKLAYAHNSQSIRGSSYVGDLRDDWSAQ